MSEKLDKVKETVGSAVKAVADKTTQLAKIAQLKVEIQASKIKLGNIYKKLGRLYYTYKKTENINEEDTSELIKEADALTAKISDLEKELFIVRHSEVK